MSGEQKASVPKKTAGDYVHAAAKGALSAVPVVGGPLTEVFQAIFGPPLEKRRDAWIQSLAEALEALRKKVDGFSPEALSGNPEFVSTLVSATHVALRNHQQEKIDALRNAVLNAALGKLADFDLRSIFLNLTDRLTPLHIAVLSAFRDPGAMQSVATRFSRTRMGGLSHVLEVAVPALAGKRSVYDVIWRDLTDAGLIHQVGLHVTMSGHSLLIKRTSDLGDAFLDFIARPSELG